MLIFLIAIGQMCGFVKNIARSLLGYYCACSNGPSLSNRIESGRPIRIRIESGSFAACPSCRNPLAKVDGSTPECAQVCALHMRAQSTALGDAKENRNSRRLSSYRRKPQNWYYVTHFLAHPIEPRDRWVQTHATVG